MRVRCVRVGLYVCVTFTYSTTDPAGKGREELHTNGLMTQCYTKASPLCDWCVCVCVCVSVCVCVLVGEKENMLMCVDLQG